MIFHGSIRNLMYETGMSCYLYARGVLLKEFNQFAPHYSAQLKIQTQKMSLDQGREFI